MLKRETFSATYSFGTVLLLCADIISGDCPSGMIRIGNLCFNWRGNEPTDLYNAGMMCQEKGGHLAGHKGNFLETLLENPVLEDYLPKENCYWVVIPLVETRILGYDILTYALPNLFRNILSLTLQAYVDSYLCFRDNKWIVDDGLQDIQNYFVCQYDVSIFKKVRRRPDVKIKVVRMAMDSSYIADQPLFLERAPLPTMCSRLCQGITACSMFNYNKVTKECRGFGEMDNTCIHYHQDWQLWMFD